MKSEGSIRHKLKRVVFYHLKKAVQKKMAQKSWNCKFESEEPYQFTDSDGTVQICRTCTLLGGGCDDTVVTLPIRARHCSSFQSKHDPEQIKAEFREFMETAAPGEMAYRFPDVHALMWVLEEEVLDTDDMVPEDPSKPLMAALGEVRDAMLSLNTTIASKPMTDPDLRQQVELLSDRLGGVEKNLPTETQKGFWASLFGSFK